MQSKVVTLKTIPQELCRTSITGQSNTDDNHPPKKTPPLMEEVEEAEVEATPSQALMPPKTHTHMREFLQGMQGDQLEGVLPKVYPGD